MEQLNKAEIGKRIRHLRKELGLRQWQLAEELESTQPAVHKYENGIIPEVRRLIHLARIGNTTIEWILTGKQWENGSNGRERFSPEVYRLAERFHRFTPDQKRALESTLKILDAAIRAQEKSTGKGPEETGAEGVRGNLGSLNPQTLAALRTAIRIHEAVVEELADSKVKEFESSGFLTREPRAV